MNNKLTIISVQEKDWDKLPYLNVKDDLGFAIPKENKAYIRITPDYEENKDTFHHELEELLSDTSAHEDENGIRHKSFWSKVASFVAPVLGPIGSMFNNTSKAISAEKAAKTAQSQAEGQANEQLGYARSQGEEVKQAGKTAREQMLASGQPSAEEQARLGRYSTKATTPAESLMTESGPIAQAVARRVQERVDNPGMDYNMNSANFEQNVGQPIWRALKARGITPPPGSTGGGLGTQQYMTGVAPKLAELQSGQINTDIARGQQYGQTANALQQYYTNLENALGEAIRNRLYSSGLAGAEAQQSGEEVGAKLGVGGSEAMTQSLIKQFLGRLGQAQTQAESYTNAAQKQGDMLSQALLAALTGGTSAAVGGLSPGQLSGTTPSAGMQPGGVLSTPPTSYTDNMSPLQKARTYQALKD